MIQFFKKNVSIFSLFIVTLFLSHTAFSQVTLPTVNLGFKSTSNPTEVVKKQYDLKTKSQ